MKPQIGTGAKAEIKGHAHPTARTFLTVGAVLAVITAIEFGILYVKNLSGAPMVVVLGLLSVLKFFLVAAYFMHLRFDPRLLAAVFTVGVVLASLITIALKFVNLA